jgi:hypothetical protein
MLNSKAKAKRNGGSKNRPKKIVTTVVRNVANVNSKRKRRRKGKLGAAIGSVRGMRGAVARLSMCSEKFLIAMTDPWNSKAFGVCVPVPTGPTFKAHGFLRSTIQISNTLAGSGFAWFLISPSAANNVVQVIHSTSAYPRDDINPFSGGTPLAGVQELVVNNLPYPTTAFLPDIDGKPAVASRVVSAGLRIRFVGRAIDVGGLVYSLREPFHMSTQIAADVATRSQDIGTLGSRQGVKIRNLDRNWVTVCDFPCDRKEMDICSFVDNRNAMVSLGAATTKTIFPFSRGESEFYDEQIAGPTGRNTNGVQLGIPTMLIAINGTPGMTVEYDYRIHVEYNGPPAAALTSRNPSDLIGAETVQAAMQEVTQGAEQATDPPSVFNSARVLVGEIQSALSEHVVRPLAGSAADLAGSVAMGMGGLALERARQGEYGF